MALRKNVILRSPHGGRLEGRTARIPVVAKTNVRRHFGGADCGVSPSLGFFAPGEEKIVWPIRLSRLIEDWVYLILPPGGITVSDPPGTSDMYLSPSSPAEMISA